MNINVSRPAPKLTVSPTEIRLGEQNLDANSRRPFKARFNLLAVAMMLGAFLVGCKTPGREESFSRPFDAAKVAQLSHEAYRVGWNATYWAKHDLRFAAFQPTPLDYEAVRYLDELTWRVPWLASNIEKNPATPRVASKRTYDYVAYETMMLRTRYQPTSFRPSTCEKIEHVLKLIDEIAPYYAQKQEADVLKAQRENGAGN